MMQAQVEGTHPLVSLMTNFGASFKKAREFRGITLDQIAKETRISTRFLAAIENEEFHLLPGGVFNRGFIRTFAERVGLDPDEALADYERLVSAGEPNDVQSSTHDASTRRDRHLYPAAVAILALAIGIFYFVTREGQPVQTATAPPISKPTPQVQQPPAPVAAAETTPDTTPVAVAEQTPPPTVVSAPAPAPAPAPSQALTLDIEAHEKTWIKVTSDGNSVLAGEVLEPGMTRKFTAESSIYISVGNAAGLTLKINDKVLKPLGKSGQVRSVTITPATLNDFIG
jgi:cytoskeleton protein RodZ